MLSIDIIGMRWTTDVQLRNRCVADALRGTVGRDELGMRRFEFLQPIEQAVVLEIADRRRGVDVIGAVVRADFGAEGVELLLNVVGHATDFSVGGAGFASRDADLGLENTGRRFLTTKKTKSTK